MSSAIMYFSYVVPSSEALMNSIAQLIVFLGSAGSWEKCICWYYDYYELPLSFPILGRRWTKRQWDLEVTLSLSILNLAEQNLHPSLFLCWKGTLISKPTNWVAEVTHHADGVKLGMELSTEDRFLHAKLGVHWLVVGLKWKFHAFLAYKHPMGISLGRCLQNFQGLWVASCLVVLQFGQIHSRDCGQVGI